MAIYSVLDSVELRSLCVCAVCGRMSLPSQIKRFHYIRPHTAQTHKELTSTQSNLVTAQNTAHEPPENGRTYGPKHVGATSLKCF